jgi:heptaprenyl diphosphate synthase
MVLLALALALALALNGLERVLPVILPGVKPGLANVVSLLVLLFMGWRSAWAVLGLRIVIATVFFGGNMLSFACSSVGGGVSLTAMALLLKLFRDQISLPAVSVAGAVVHNLGQLLVVAFLVRSVAVAGYLPVLLFSGVAAGFAVGLLASWLAGRIERALEGSCSRKG